MISWAGNHCEMIFFLLCSKLNSLVFQHSWMHVLDILETSWTKWTKLFYQSLVNNIVECFLFFDFVFLTYFGFSLPVIPLIHSFTSTHPLPPQSPDCCTYLWVLYCFYLISPLPTPRVVNLLSMYESVSIMLVSFVCSLGSTYEWNHRVFVFLWHAYSLSIMFSRSIHAIARDKIVLFFMVEQYSII